MVLGGGALLLVFDLLAWRGVFLLMALLVALTTAPVLWLDGRRPSVVVEAASLRAFWRRPDAVPLLALLATYKFGEAFAVAMLRPRLVDLGLTLAQLGWLVGTVGFAAGLAGALVGGSLVTRVGRRRALVLFGAAQSLAVLGYAQLGAGTPGSALALALGFEHFTSGLATAALFTCIMDWSRADAAGTDATVQASTVVVATGLASALAGFSATRLGYQAHFIVAALLSCVAVAVVAALFPFITQQEPKGESPCASPSTQAASTR
jgi:predicted MFS family arabinose efflux permease